VLLPDLDAKSAILRWTGCNRYSAGPQIPLDPTLTGTALKQIKQQAMEELCRQQRAN
jgi:hypothetical protein